VNLALSVVPCEIHPLIKPCYLISVAIERHRGDAIGVKNGRRKPPLIALRPARVIHIWVNVCKKSVFSI
jgi:hypothetical protein